MIKRLLACVLCILILTGCWDKKELDELGIVGAVGMDKDAKTGEIIVTTLIMRPGALKKEGSGGTKGPIELVVTKGNTIVQAIRNISKEFDRKPFYSHYKVLVIGDNLAREGIMPVLDVLVRDRESRRLTKVVVAKNTNASNMLGVEHGIDTVQSSYMDRIMKNAVYNSQASNSKLIDILKTVSGTVINPVTGAIQLIEQPNMPSEEEKGTTSNGIKLSGTSVFKKDKLVGYLDETESRGLNWVTGKVKSGVILIASPGEKDKLISILIKKSSSSIKPQIKDGKISFTIKVKEVGDIDEQQGRDDVTELELIDKIENEQKQVIENEIRKAIDKAQNEYHSDIFGFGNALYKKYPSDWEKMKDNWDSIFPNVRYTVKVESKIERTGLLKKPFKLQ